MRQARALATYPAGRPLNADQVVEYHAARLLLLMNFCGVKQRIEGLTKLAKLDFFVRYPAHFERAAAETGEDRRAEGSSTTGDAMMVRHHYGPWDPRYYQVLAFLESRNLVRVDKQKKTFVFALTDEGVRAADLLAVDASYAEVVAQMRRVKAAFGNRSGDWLKKLVYKVFDAEVAKLARGEVIR